MIIKPESIVYDGEQAEYIILNLVGSGAFGHVYKIKKRDDQSIWALKTLPADFKGKNILKGLINEGHLATKVSHKNVIKYIFIHDGALFEGLPPYIIMEFASQGTLKEVIQHQKEEEKFIANDQLKNYFNQLIDGMEAINSKLIHRDIKPDNILIKDNLLKISDFGLSKIIQEQTRTYTFKGIGHIRYMSPEVWKDAENDIRMDIYSMGIVFFELATLDHPLEVDLSDGIQKWREAHLFQNPKKPESVNKNLTSAFSQLILGMLEKSRSRRFQNWYEIRSILLKKDLPSKSNSILIENILKKRLDKDNKIRKKQLDEERRQENIEEFKNLVKYQFESDILEPLKNFIEEFNRKYSGGKIQISSHPGEIIYEIILVSGHSLILEIRSLIDEEFIREKEIDDYGQKIMVRQLERPLFENRKIMAWGYLTSQENRGFNIILVEKEGSVYGDWFVLINTNSALSSHGRLSEPFPFNFDEIEKEIKLIRVMHIYETKIEPLQIVHFVKFIEEYI